MKVWIARDKDKTLAIYSGRPGLSPKKEFFITGNSEDEAFLVPKADPLGEGVTFENSPQEIELVRG